MQRRWLDLVKDYDCEILCHPCKENVVADALIRKTKHYVLRVKSLRMVVTPGFFDCIRAAQVEALSDTDPRKERIKGQKQKSS